MNLVFNEWLVNAGRLRAFLEREEQLHQLVAKQPGTRATITARSCGNPMRFGRGGLAESPGAVHAILASAEFEAFAAANPARDITTPLRPLELYESVTEVGEAAAALKPGMHLVIVDWTLLPGIGVADAFENSRKALFELRRDEGGGFVRSSMYRFLGSPNRYLIVNTSTGRDAVRAAMRAPKMQAFVAGHPASTYAAAAPAINEYEVFKVTH